jgi:ABC-2 type transport system ATP-binding protein
VIGYLRLELARTVRDVRYLVLAIAAPVGFYLLFAAVFGGPSNGAPDTFGLPASVEIMVAMATFGAMWAALSSTAPRLARDREGGWLTFLRTTPLRPLWVLAARIAAGLLVALPAIVGVGITGVLAHGVQLSAGQWAAGLVLLWVGTLPFIALGIAIGSLTSSTVAYALSTGFYFGFAALGGLWVPPGILSPTLRDVAMALPSYNQAALGWEVASGGRPTVDNVVVLAAWTTGLALLALAAQRHPRRRATEPAAVEVDANETISLGGLSKRFGAVVAVDKIDLQVSRGSTLALLGPNGAGKTTTISLLLGILEPSAGSVRLFGSTPNSATRSGQVGVMLQDNQLMSGVRVGELIRFFRSLYRSPVDQSTLLGMAGIGDVLRRRTDLLSGGQAQRVRFALAAIGNPRLLVLDEPTAAMDVQARQSFWAGLHAYTSRGATVLFSTHYLQEADDHADRVVVMRSGRIVADGTPEEVKAAGGAGRVVRFQLLDRATDRFDRLPGVTSVERNGRTVTLHTGDADATVWGLFPLRDAVSHLEVGEGDLEAAFLSLTAPADPGSPGGIRAG